MISVSNVSMRFGSKVLFDDVSTTFSPGRRYGLTGPNGAGKSTFMKMLAGALEPQKGTVVRPRKLGVLRQDQFAFDRQRVLDVVLMGNQRLWSALDENDTLLARPTSPTRTGSGWANWRASSARRTATSAESDAAVLLQGLGLPEAQHERTMGELPGGQKLRVLLAQALFGKPEGPAPRRADQQPGPRLDPLAASASWTRYEGVLIAISHDRHFLNGVCTHIADIDYETIITYTGGYDDMVMAKTQIRSRIESENAQKREEDRATPGLHRPLRRRHARGADHVAPQGSGAAADHRAGTVEHPAPVHPVHAEPSIGPSGRRVRRPVEGIWRSRRDRQLHGRRQPRREDRARGPQRRRQDDAPEGPPGRLAEPGPGAGKSGRGSLRWGHEVQIGYFPQDHTGLIEPGLTAVEWLHRFDPDAARQDIHGLLGQMLFSGEEGLKPTEALSGGETARLLFCRIMLQKPNVLVFDEPTSHLDLESINALNIALQKFEGTVLLVTHDQDLLEEVGTRVWHVEGGRVADFKGTYEEFEGSLVEG